MFLGIDLGTTSVKVLLLSDEQKIVATTSSSLNTTTPRPLWSEQDPELMWQATDKAVLELKEKHSNDLAKVQAIGLSGQMHGAILLDKKNKILRPAILWNDGRSYQQCQQLLERHPQWLDITGNLLMPGFTAPKLLWIKQHESDIFKNINKVLLPKDYLRFRLSNQYVTDMSDASGTAWLNVEQRCWAESLVVATDLKISHMPDLAEGIENTGTINNSIADRWGISHHTRVVGGGGDNAASAISMNVIEPGQAFISLGTSGVYFVAKEKYHANPYRAVHSYCHCLPNLWHQMSVHLSAANSLTWLANTVVASDIRQLLSEAQNQQSWQEDLIFLPYLSGERTPHNNPHAKGVLFGLTTQTTRANITQAVLAGVAMAFFNGQQAMEDSGTVIKRISVIGGGAKSQYWCQILADCLNKTLCLHHNRETGGALGAARLAWFNYHGGDLYQAFQAPPIETILEPNINRVGFFNRQKKIFNEIYLSLCPNFEQGE